MLYAEPHQVVPEFAEAANRKMYKKRSASVYLPDSPGNPVPGKHYLRHIGFLGAVPPAIKGIPDALNFAEDDGDLVIEFAEAPYAVTALTEILRRLRDFFVEREGAERADQLIPQWQLSSIEEDARRCSHPRRQYPGVVLRTRNRRRRRRSSLCRRCGGAAGHRHPIRRCFRVSGRG
ncbi:hypothetical protein P4237_00095 [Pseudomonas aeruginosa]|nr:hypothetical protein [Pseudomonas aeruginosa]